MDLIQGIISEAENYIDLPEVCDCYSDWLVNIAKSLMDKANLVSSLPFKKEILELCLNLLEIIKMQSISTNNLPELFKIQVFISEIFEILGNLPGAILELESALEVFSNSIENSRDLHLRIGSLYYKNNYNPQKALDHLEKGIKLCEHPSHISILKAEIIRAAIEAESSEISKEKGEY
jgi:tetratricopeptide (TPR) repeat protein